MQQHTCIPSRIQSMSLQHIDDCSTIGHAMLRLRLLNVLALLPLLLGCCDARSRSASDSQPPSTVPQPSFMNCFLPMHEQFVQRASKGDVRVLFIGDSITDAWRKSGRKIWKQHLAPLGAVNFGIPGDRTEFVLWRLERGELEGINPRVIVLMIGTNNLKQGEVRMSPEDTAAGVRAVLDLIRQKLPDTKILLLGILPRQPKYDWIADAIDDTNARLATFADGNTIHFLDFSDRFLEEGGRLNEALYGPDLLHLSPAGYEVWADAMTPLLDDLLAEPAAPASP